MLPFYPGEEGSLSFNLNISLDGSTPHIREISFVETGNATYEGGDVVQVLDATWMEHCDLIETNVDACFHCYKLALLSDRPSESFRRTAPPPHPMSGMPP